MLYNKTNTKIINILKYIATYLAYAIIFYTLWMINVLLFWIILFIFIANKIFKMNLMCKLFGHVASNNSRHGIVRCKRCNEPLYRIK